MASNTIVHIASSGQDFPLPGTSWTADSIKSSLSSVVQGIATMDVVQSTRGDDILFTFSQRTGTKG